MSPIRKPLSSRNVEESQGNPGYPHPKSLFSLSGISTQSCYSQYSNSSHAFFQKERIPPPRKGSPDRFRYHCKCGDTFTSKDKLKAHIKAEVYGKLFKCPECSDRFYTHQTLTLHMKTDHDDVDYVSKFGCHDCGEVFDTMQDHRRHRKLAGHPDLKLGKPTIGPEPRPSQPKITQFFARSQLQRLR